MRRLLRILSNVAAVLSLLACLTACVFWARSYWSLDGYMSDTTELRSDHGLRRYRLYISNRGLLVATWRDRRLGGKGQAKRVLPHSR